jgi:hypothetical protein
MATAVARCAPWKFQIDRKGFLVLTKTAYLAYGQCPKNFWLSQHRPELAAPPDPATQRRLRAGQEVDQCAREQFPHGRLIPYRPHPTDMATLTVQILAEGVETLFQATFIVDDLLVKADILTYDDNGRHLIEVKSGTGYKKAEHLLDVAFQVHVLRSSGLDVTRAGVMHLNSHCRHPDLSNLFTLTDVTDDVWAFLPQVEADVINMRGLVAQTETPELSIGRHCARPYPCPFYNHCWQDVKEWTIYDIPYLKPPLEQQLEAEGVRYVTDVPSGFKLGDKRAAAFVARIRHRQVEIDAAAIGAELDSLVYPLYFFDFETIDYAIPIYAGCTPYQQVPFQYSCHILEENGSLIHCDYLHTTTGDPRPQLVESLLGHIGETGHLVAYNSSFEGGILRHLAAHFPGRADPLAQMADRLWDQLAIIRRHYRHHGFGKSNSLKSVLPVVVPRLSYETLAVQDGAQAQVVWEEMIGCQDTTTKSRLAEQLKGYCYLDTLAMVEIHQELSTL